MFKFVGVVVVVGAIALTAGVLGGFVSFSAPDVAATSKGKAEFERVTNQARAKAAEGLRKAASEVGHE